MRINPGPFEPIVYFLETPAGFRIIAVGGFILFTVLFVWIAAAHGASFVIFALILLSAMIAARMLARAGGGMGKSASTRAAALAAIYILYGLFWMWHRPALGLVFTLWAPLALISAASPAGLAWRSGKAE
ncbi:MAG TPA: hypothetical protein VMV27_01570 [Candidatus Binataceae bacterium]|nr:hypothetical protein [Candidatus Binataceae bacterium]